MRIYEKRFLGNKAKEAAQGTIETKDAIIYDVLPAQRLARVQIQGSSALITAHYQLNWQTTPEWLKPGNAVKINFVSGDRGRIELIGHGSTVPTPVSGGTPFTPATADDAVITSGGLLAEATPSTTIVVPAGTVRIGGVIYPWSATTKTQAAAPAAGYYRYDIVVVGADGTVDYVTGTPATSSPAVPAVPANHAMIGNPILLSSTSSTFSQTSVGRTWTTPYPYSVDVTLSKTHMHWNAGGDSATVTATVYDQYGETITPAGAGLASYDFTISWVSGNGNIDSVASPGTHTHSGVTANYSSFTYTRNNLSSDSSPTFQVSVNTVPAISGISPQLDLYDANDATMYGGGSAPGTGTPGASVTIDWSLNHTWRITLDQATVFTFTGALDGDKLTLIIIGNGYAVTWPASVRYGTDIPAMGLSSGGKQDYIGFIYDGAASKYDVVALSRGF